MGYLIKANVINAIHEDKETSLMCYDDKPSKDIVRFCYESIEREIDGLPQYAVDNTTESDKINFAVAILAEVAERAKQEDTPIYKGDEEVDYYVRLSDVNEAINKYLNESIN